MWRVSFIWDETELSEVSFFRECFTVKEVLNLPSDIRPYDIPVLLVKDTSHSICIWGTAWFDRENSITNLLFGHFADEGFIDYTRDSWFKVLKQVQGVARGGRGETPLEEEDVPCHALAIVSLIKGLLRNILSNLNESL